MSIERCPACGVLPSQPCGLGPGVTGDGMTSCGPREPIYGDDLPRPDNEPDLPMPGDRW